MSESQRKLEKKYQRQKGRVRDRERGESERKREENMFNGFGSLESCRVNITHRERSRERARERGCRKIKWE